MRLVEYLHTYIISFLHLYEFKSNYKATKYSKAKFRIFFFYNTETFCIVTRSDGLFTCSKKKMYTKK